MADREDLKRSVPMCAQVVLFIREIVHSVDSGADPLYIGKWSKSLVDKVQAIEHRTVLGGARTQPWSPRRPTRTVVPWTAGAFAAAPFYRHNHQRHVFWESCEPSICDGVLDNIFPFDPLY